MSEFNKDRLTIITENGKHLIMDEEGVLKGQIKSVVINEVNHNNPLNGYFNNLAEITFQVNICKDREEALKKYRE